MVMLVRYSEKHYYQVSLLAQSLKWRHQQTALPPSKLGPGFTSKASTEVVQGPCQIGSSPPRRAEAAAPPVDCGERQESLYYQS